MFETSIWLHVFGRSMLSIFIPILLLQQGYSITELMVFFLIFNIFDFPLNFFAKWLTSKIGARKVIMLGVVALIIYFFCLYSLTPNNWPLLIAMALAAALYDTFYWVAHIYYFMRCSKHDDNVSKDISWLYIVKRVAAILAPIIGAAIIIFVNQGVLILVSIAILVLSLWPLFKIKDTRDKPKKGSVLGFREFFKNWEGTKDYVIQGLWSFHSSSEGVIWPIFIYVLFKNVESVAIIPVIVSITAIVFTYFTGRMKKANRGVMVTVGAMMVAIVWVLRLVIENNVFYYVSVFLTGLFSIMVALPLESSIYEKGEKRDALSASTYRNTISMFPRIFFYGALVVMLEVFKVSFLAAAISLFVLMAVSYVFFVKKPTVKIKRA